MTVLARAISAPELLPRNYPGLVIVILREELVK